MQHESFAKVIGRKPSDRPRDLADFHLRWADFRPAMMALQTSTCLLPEQAETLGWLIALSDRVSADDIGH
ncbi:MAG: hypothetical protein Q7T25_10445 [Sideroxyarcus sp.]|nr:hypothetical protein [Sideroxyarcus sp.]